VQVPGELLERAADRRGAGDDAHAVGQLELVEGVAKLVPVLALDPAGDPAAPRVVRHQDEIPSRQGNKSRERGALGAALVLLDLDDDLLALAQRVLDAGAAYVDAFLEIAAGDFLEGQEPVPLLAVVDESGEEAGLDPGDDSFIDVALALFPRGGLNIEVDELLPVDARDPQLFLLGRIEQHALHLLFSCARRGPHAWSVRALLKAEASKEGKEGGH